MSAHRFAATLYRWDARTDSWVFADLPFEVADQIEDEQTGPRRGFGSVRVEVELGASRWRTSVFPSKERRTFVLPVKRAILEAEAVAPGDTVDIRVQTLS